MNLTVETFDLLTNNKYEMLSLHRQNANGGVKNLTFEDIDTLRRYPHYDAITILGLQQDTFEYFIEKYAPHFKVIRFCQNRDVLDWSSLGKLKNIEFLDMFSNHGMTSLWDMSENDSLKALSIGNSPKLHSIVGIEKAPALRRFELGEVRDATTVIDTFAPLSGTKIEYLSFAGKKIENCDLAFLRNMPSLKHFDFPTNLFTVEQIAWIVANFPHLEGYALCAKIDAFGWNEETHTMNVPYTLIVGKRKPFLMNEGNEAKIKRYIDRFDQLVEFYKGEETPYLHQ